VLVGDRLAAQVARFAWPRSWSSRRDALQHVEGTRRGHAKLASDDASVGRMRPLAIS
jgi:hypothetical protein